MMTVKRTTSTACLLAMILVGSTLARAQHHGHGDRTDHGTHKGHIARTKDTRILVNLPPALAEHTLANMRDHLVALQAINDALAHDAFDTASRIAEQRLGMSSLRLHGAHEVAKFMPQGMRDAGTAMHRAASRFAIEAQNAGVTGDLKPALRSLSEVMTACVGCHAGYRLK